MDTGEGTSSSTLQEGAAGRVSDGGDAPIAGALVMPEGLDPGTPPIPEIAVMSGADGRYAWRLRPGRYRITASAPGYDEMTVEVRVEAGRIAVVDFTLGKSP